MKTLLGFLGGVLVAAVLFVMIDRKPSAKVAHPEPAPYVPAEPAVPKPEAVEAAPQPQVVAKSPPIPSPSVVARKPVTSTVAKASRPEPSPIATASTPVEPPQAPPAAPVATSEPVASPPSAAPMPAEKVAIRKPNEDEIRRAKEEVRASTVTLPAGTVLNVRLNQALSSETNENGDAFQAVLVEPLVADGFVIAERGSRVDGKVSDAIRAGKVKGLSRLAVRLTTVHTSDRQRVTILTDDFVREGVSSKTSDAAKVGVGAGIGAALGAIFGGGKGAAIGAAAGGAAGGGTVLMTRGKPVELGVETRIPFRLKEAVTITENIP